MTDEKKVPKIKAHSKERESSILYFVRACQKLLEQITAPLGVYIREQTTQRVYEKFFVCHFLLKGIHLRIITHGL